MVPLAVRMRISEAVDPLLQVPHQLSLPRFEDEDEVDEVVGLDRHPLITPTDKDMGTGRVMEGDNTFPPSGRRLRLERTTGLNLTMRCFDRDTDRQPITTPHDRVTLDRSGLVGRGMGMDSIMGQDRTLDDNHTIMPTLSRMYKEKASSMD